MRNALRNGGLANPVSSNHIFYLPSRSIPSLQASVLFAPFLTQKASENIAEACRSNVRKRKVISSSPVEGGPPLRNLLGELLGSHSRAK